MNIQTGKLLWFRNSLFFVRILQKKDVRIQKLLRGIIFDDIALPPLAPPHFPLDLR